MNQVKSDIAFYKSYLNGFHDLIEHTSAKQVCKGIGKILSYVSIVAPIIFGIKLYLSRQKLQQLARITSKVSKVIEKKTSSQTGKAVELSQNEMTQFLSIQVADSKYDKIHAMFQQLSLNSQKRLFTTAMKQKKLEKVIQQVPKSITKIAFDLEFDQGEIKKVIKKLKTFPQLELIQFDVSKTTYYTGTVKNYIHSIVFSTNTFEKFGFPEPKLDYVVNGSSMSPNKISPAIEAIKGSAEHLKQSKVGTEIYIKFKHLTMHYCSQLLEKRKDGIYEWPLLQADSFNGRI